MPDPYSRPRGCPFSIRWSEFIGGTCDATRSLPPMYRTDSGYTVRYFFYEEGSEMVELAVPEAELAEATTG